jgi:hypothetical protein
MKRLVVLAALVLCGCTTAPSKPAVVGMTVDEYRQACSLGDIVTSESAGWIVGECTDKPQEYVEFRAGRVALVMTSLEMFDRLAQYLCKDPEVPDSCRDAVMQRAAEHESRKAEKGRDARAADFNRMISGISIGPGPSSDSYVPRVPGASGTSTDEACYFKSEQSAGMNKICFYDCIGSLSTIARNMSSVSLCPMSVSR